MELSSIRQKASAIRNELVKEQIELASSTIALAFGRIQDRALEIIRSNLDQAIKDTKEYNISELSAPLFGLFADKDVLAVTEDGEIYHLAEEVVGDYNDFLDGIELARATLGVGGGGASAAAFWRKKIYEPYRMNVETSAKGYEFAANAYERTIEARKAGWSGKAPYWLILEYGNYGDSFAFPQFAGTYFLDKSIRAIQKLFNLELQHVNQEIENTLNTEMLSFLNNPDQYQPGTIFEETIIEGKRYFIYVTKTRKLGIAQRPR